MRAPTPTPTHNLQVAASRLLEPSGNAVVLRSLGDFSSVTAASVWAAGESAFNLSFALDRPGTINFLVLYASLLARHVTTYVAFDNNPGDVGALATSDLAAFSDGVVARGSCAVTQAQVTTVCRIGPVAGIDASPGAYSCSPTVSCQVQNVCFGALCDYWAYAIVPNSTYKV